MFPDIFIIAVKPAKTPPDSSWSRQVWAPDLSVHILKQVRILYLIQNIFHLPISWNPPPAINSLQPASVCLNRKKASIAQAIKRNGKREGLGTRLRWLNFFRKIRAVKDNFRRFGKNWPYFRLKTWREQQEHISTDSNCYLKNVCAAW